MHLFKHFTGIGHTITHYRKYRNMPFNNVSIINMLISKGIKICRIPLINIYTTLQK